MRKILVDRRNFESVKEEIKQQVSTAPYLGFDIESQDADAHEGIKKYRGKKTAKVFDTNRTTVTGFSLHAPKSDTCWYINLAHKDVENRLTWLEAKSLLDAKPASVPFIVHNSKFERTILWKSLAYDIGEAICTLQLAVSTFGPDEYRETDFAKIMRWPVTKLIPEICRQFRTYDPNITRELTSKQRDILAKVVAKESDASHSYNGFIKEITYGYGLKKLVKSLFGIQMATFEETLHGAAHMGELTGEQVVEYGCDDAFYAVAVFETLLLMITPEALKAFMETENPMTKIYAEIWRDGIRIDLDAVNKKKIEEEQNCKDVTARLKAIVHSALPFPAELNDELLKRQDWYSRVDKKGAIGGEKWRQKVIDWDDKFNPTYYSAVRTILYDLFCLPLKYDQGELASDGEARGKMFDDATGGALEALKAINELASIQQRIKLYLTPYPLLTDPETKHIYPSVSSMLATRRMAASFPNFMQLSKRGESTYIRGFYLPDNDDHLIVSLDWRQIELVLIGEFSGDPKFAEAYGQLPYQDLHKFAAVAVLSAIENQEISIEDFDKLRLGENPFNFPLVDEKGMPLTPKDCYKFNRSTMGGKGCNFEYFYSGSLSNLATRRGLSPEKMRRLVQSYEAMFPVAVNWRNELINQGRAAGKVILPDGHTRVRFEATALWQAMMANYWRSLGDNMDVEDRNAIEMFGRQVIYKIQRRSFNQLCNAMIQGTCAALAKRSVLGIRRKIDELHLNARHLLDVHDELVFSVHRDHIIPFIRVAREVMTSHPDIFKNLKVDASVSIGRTFEPWHVKRAPFGQVELDEAPNASFIPEEKWNGVLNDDEVEGVIRALAA